MSFIFKNYNHKLLLGPGNTGTVQQYLLRSKQCREQGDILTQNLKKTYKKCFLFQSDQAGRLLTSFVLLWYKNLCNMLLFSVFKLHLLLYTWQIWYYLANKIWPLFFLLPRACRASFKICRGTIKAYQNKDYWGGGGGGVLGDGGVKCCLSAVICL